jgi:hypothetical protein
MTRRPECWPELAELISALCEQTITDEQFARLNELLESDPAARCYYAVYMDMHVGLARRWGADNPAGVPPGARSPIKAALRQPLIWATAAAAILAIVGVSLWLARIGFPGTADNRPMVSASASSTPPESEVTTSSVAILRLAADAVWADSSAAPAVGSPLAPGWLRLKSGSVVVQFFNGATVILDGPAELQILSADQAFCRSGRVSAEVPLQAAGFRISTPQVAVVDLGTAFGLDVKPDRAEVHVLQGEVAIQELPTAVPNLKEGEAIAVAHDGRIERMPAQRWTFLSARELERQAAASCRQQYEAWRAAAPKLNTAAGLLVRFDFEKDSTSGQRLLNVASQASVAYGTVVGCGQAEGRWPAKGALEFRTLSDRLRVRLPGPYASITLAAWVRVDALDRAFTSLFMCEGYSPGGFHWQIGRKGDLRLGVKGENQKATDYCSPVVFGPDQIGQWVHLAVVYDADARRVTHFVDAQPVSRTPLRFDVPLRIGNADIGNWNVGPHSSIYPVRCFTGRMDELALYGRALTDHDIRELYELGMPKPASSR